METYKHSLVPVPFRNHERFLGHPCINYLSRDQTICTRMCDTTHTNMDTKDLEKQDSETIRSSQDTRSEKESWDQASKESQAEDVRPSRETDTASHHRGDSDDESDDSDHPDILSRIVSRVTSRSSVTLGPPPDGGWLAWSQCKSQCRLAILSAPLTRQ